MLVPLFLYDLKYNFPYLIDYFIGVITPKVFRVLQKRRRCVDGRYDESWLAVVNEVDTLDCHFDQQQRHFFNVFYKKLGSWDKLFALLVYSLQVVDQLLFYFVVIGLMEVEMSDEVNLEREEGEELTLFLNDLLLSYSSVGYLFWNYFGV